MAVNIHVLLADAKEKRLKMIVSGLLGEVSPHFSGLFTAVEIYSSTEELLKLSAYGSTGRGSLAASASSFCSLACRLLRKEKHD